MGELIDIGLLVVASKKGFEIFDELLNHLGVIGKSLGALGLAGVAAVGGLASMAIDAAKSVEAQAFSVKKLSEVYGVSTQSIQQWHGALMLAGDSTTSFDSAMQRLDMRTGLLRAQFDATGKVSKTAAQFFKELGMTSTELSNIVSGREGTSDALQSILGKLAAMPNASERAAVGARILGGSYKDLIDLYDQSGGHISDWMKKVQDSGYVLDDAAIKKAAEATFAQNLLGLQFKGISNIVGTAMLPAMKSFSDLIEKLIPTIRSWAEYIGSVLIPNLLTMASNVVPKIVSAVGNFYNFIKDKVVPVLVDWWNKTKPIRDALIDLAQQISSQVIQPILDFVTHTGDAAGKSTIWKSAVDDIAGAIKILADHMNLVNPALKIFIGFMVAKKLWEFSVGAAAVAGALWVQVPALFAAAAGWGVYDTLAVIGVAITLAIGLAVLGFIAILVLFFTHLHEVGDAIKWVWDKVTTFIGWIVALGKTINGLLGDPIKQLQDALGNIGRAFGDVWDWIDRVIRKIGDLAGAIANSGVGKFVGGVGGTASNVVKFFTGGAAAGGWVGLHGPELKVLGEEGPEYVSSNREAMSGGNSQSSITPEQWDAHLTLQTQILDALNAIAKKDLRPAVVSEIGSVLALARV